jgi:hypothetical protein
MDFGVGQFEQIYSVTENITGLSMPVPLSDVAYYTGRIIERAIKQAFGDHTLFFVGLHFTAENKTDFMFKNVGTVEQLQIVNGRLENIRRRLTPILGRLNAEDRRANTLTAQEAVEVPFRPEMVARPKEIITRMNDRYVRMHTLLQHILLAVTEETRSVAAAEAGPAAPAVRPAGAGQTYVETDTYVMF